MASYLVTGGAGFIGSHLAEELCAAATWSASPTTSSRRPSRATSSTCRAWTSSRATSPTCQPPRGRCGGMDYVLHQAAIPSVPRSVKDPVTSNRANIDAHAEHPRRRARRRRQAPRLRRVLVGVRQHADAAQARGRCRRTRSRPTRSRRSWASSTASMFTALYGLRDGLDPLLQRLRAAAGSGLAVLRRHLALLDGAARRPPADHLRRR